MMHSLTLGGLLLTDGLPSEDGYVLNVIGDGTSFGVAQSVQEVVTSLLADGDLVRTTRYGNREVTFPVEITGSDLAAVARGEAALRRELGKGNTLTWQPPDAFAVPTVFEVVASSMSQTFNDLDEVMRRRRTFVVTLECSPGARSVDATVITALAPPPATPVTASITNADTVTGWSAVLESSAGTSSVTPTDQGSSVRATGTGDYLTLTLSYSRSAISLSTTPYLVIEASGIGILGGVFATLNGVTRKLPIVRTIATLTGTTLMVYATQGENFSGFRISSTQFVYGATATVEVYDVTATNTVPQVTARETSVVVTIGGTERTPCSLQVTPAAGESMGLAIVHTSPESGTGYSPALRQRRTSGNTVTSSAALLSGAREPVSATPIVAQIPLTSLPEDGYSLVALMRSTVIGTFPVAWQCRTFFAGNYLGGYSGTAQASFGAVGTWTLVPLAVVTLPPVRASRQAFVQLDLNRTAVGAEVIDLDEWWAFRTGDDCGLSIVTSSSSFLWLDSPDVTSPVPRVWVGTEGDRSNASHPGPGLIAQGNHVLHPDGTSLFVASSGIQNPTVVATAFRRWHSNAAS